MSDIAEVYTDAVYDNLKPLFANWDVGALRKLGDFGILEGNRFTHIGNVSDFKIEFKDRKEPRRDTRSFSSKGSTSVNITAQGEIPAGGAAAVNAKLEIGFTSEDSVFFNAAGCTYTMIENKAVLGEAIMKLYNAKPRVWDRSWVIITDVVDSTALTVAIASSSSSSIVFEADASIPNIDLASPQLKLNVKSSKNVGFQLAAAEGKNVLIGFCKIQGFLGSVFKPVNKLALASTEDLPDAPEKSANPAEVFFGQYF